MLGAIAQFETEIRTERQRAGLERIMRNAQELHRENHVDKGDERLGLFRGVVDRYDIIRNALPR